MEIVQEEFHILHSVFEISSNNGTIKRVFYRSFKIQRSNHFCDKMNEDSKSEFIEYFACKQ